MSDQPIAAQVMTHKRVPLFSTIAHLTKLKLGASQRWAMCICGGKSIWGEIVSLRPPDCGCKDFVSSVMIFG